LLYSPSYHFTQARARRQVMHRLPFAFRAAKGLFSGQRARSKEGMVARPTPARAGRGAFDVESEA